MNALVLPQRRAARLARAVDVIGWGAFNIGRN